MATLELDLSFSPASPWQEILVAELSDLGFSSFNTGQEGRLKAYSDEDPKTVRTKTDTTLLPFKEKCGLSWTWEELPEKNWNKIWESSFHPVVIAEQCRIRADFHDPDPGMAYDILINPKMSFGTGHHPTTELMVHLLLDLDLKGKTILDMGAGSGILAILCEQKGAKEVLAIDNSPWATENMKENITANACKVITPLEGDSSALADKRFNIILANINKNVVLKDLPAYENVLGKGGTLLLSGFYDSDVSDIDRIAKAEGLIRTDYRTKDHWAALTYVRK